MLVTWHSVDLKSGARGVRLTTREMGAVSRVIGEPTDLSGLGVAYTAGWESSTLPGRTMLVALDEEDQPVWGGMVVRRRATRGAWVDVDLVTLEAYFDRRFVKDHSYTGTAQGAIVSGIISGDVVASGVQFVVDSVSAMRRDREYVDDDDKTVLSVLQELMEVEGGPEFTVDLVWGDADKTVLSRVVRVRDRIGTASALPVTRFELPGNVTDFEYTEDYSSDNGANDVMATSSGEGEIRPESKHAVATDLLANGWVRFEHRFTPSTSITTQSVLDEHARAELAEVRNGLVELRLEAALVTAPRVNRDFWLGDDVAVSLTCPRFPEYVDSDGAKVAGYSRTLRCTGWSIDFDGGRLVPTLVEVS